MKLYDKNGRQMHLPPPPRPPDGARPLGWVNGFAVWGEVNAPWAHGQTLAGFVTPDEVVAVWATGMENFDGPQWDVPFITDVPLNWREMAAEYAAKQAAEEAAWQAGAVARKAAAKAAEDERAAWFAAHKNDPETEDAGSGYGRNTDE